MADITVTHERKLGVAQVEGQTDEGILLIDGWNVERMVVIDVGRIILSTDSIPSLIAAAKGSGLTVEEGDHV